MLSPWQVDRTKVKWERVTIQIGRFEVYNQTMVKLVVLSWFRVRTSAH